MLNNRDSAWTFVTNIKNLSKYGVKNISTISKAYVKIMEFNNVTSFNQRLDILVRRLDGETEYVKRKIISDFDEWEIKEDFPKIKTIKKIGL